MQGKRVEPEFYEGGSFKRLNAGEYAKVKGVWYAETPNGECANLAAHQVIEHEDGTITVSPSILVSIHFNDGRPPKELWHGFLERGVWRSC